MHDIKINWSFLHIVAIQPGKIYINLLLNYNYDSNTAAFWGRENMD